MNLFLASGNRHKQQEFASIVPDYCIKIPADLGISFAPEETGNTFLENALVKAHALYERVHGPVIADDSGLCIDALGGMPGIYSARYGMKDGIQLEAEARNNLVLQQMKGIDNRNCRFVCCIVVMLTAHRIVTVQETCEGVITQSAIGCNGFGYDPIVYLPHVGKTVAQLSAQEKNAWSHRGKAGRVLAQILKVWAPT